MASLCRRVAARARAVAGPAGRSAGLRSSLMGRVAAEQFRPIVVSAKHSVLDADILAASSLEQTPVSIQMLKVFAEQGHSRWSQASKLPARDQEELRRVMLLRAAQFLHRELPIRFAHRIVELASLPHGLADMPSIRRVAEWYKKSFDELHALPRPTSPEEDVLFTNVLQDIHRRHTPTLVTMARGILEFRRSLKMSPTEPMPPNIRDDIHRFLDIFYSSRIGIRTLMEQHVALHDETPRPGYVGIIAKDVHPLEVCRAAIADAEYMAEQRYADIPKVQVYGDPKFGFSYIPSHLRHIMFELVKNSIRAVAERHANDPAGLPPVKVIVAAGDTHEDVVIKVSDEGGGIPRSAMPQIWSYFYTTYAAPAQELLENDQITAGDFSTATPLAGLGYGLPLSRLYARYFGGDLQIISMEGYGTDAFVYLRRVSDQDEALTNTDEDTRLRAAAELAFAERS